MAQARRWKLSVSQRIEMWGRWKEGQSLPEIGRAVGKSHVVIQFLLARHGGIAPPTRRRARLTLTLAEREDISRGIASGSSMREIAKGLQRAVSTVSRANEADRQAWESALRPKRCLLAVDRKLQKIVASKLVLDWFPQDEGMRVSHETIYRSLFIQARGVLKQELVRHLRTQRRIRRSRHARDRGHHSGQIVDAISIRERPARSKREPSPAIGRAIYWAALTTATSPL
jgi:hypothetical protein